MYKFTCPCSDTYIGETTRLFDTRILEHRRTNTRVHKHIIQCNAYKTALNITYGSGPTDDQQREFIRSYFEILEKNLYNYNARVTHEGLMITLHAPSMNKQHPHKSMSLVCDCVKTPFKFVNNSGQ